jgi:hypothetical protein
VNIKRETDNIGEDSGYAPELSLQHNHNYFSRRPNLKKSSNTNQTALMTKPGQARPITMLADRDERAGIYPQNNSEGEFRKNMEVLEARTFDDYERFFDTLDLERNAWVNQDVTLTRDRLDKVAAKYANLSFNAFKQMMCISSKDQRDFNVWHQTGYKGLELEIVYPNHETGLVQFVQTIKKDPNDRVHGLTHCMFDKGKPFVINESKLDSEGKLRQIAHVGKKANSRYINALERFDDGTVVWTITCPEMSGSAGLRPNGEIIIVGGDLNDANMLAARNLGAEGIDPKSETWTGFFCLKACRANDHSMQRDYKNSVRKQVNQIIDGASLPGLEPIFDLTKQNPGKS